jgi:hypothetical protein
VTSQEPPTPSRRLVAAINDGDWDAFLVTLTPDAALTDDGRPRTPRGRIVRDIFSPVWLSQDVTGSVRFGT